MTLCNNSTRVWITGLYCVYLEDEPSEVSWSSCTCCSNHPIKDTRGQTCAWCCCVKLLQYVKMIPSNRSHNSDISLPKVCLCEQRADWQEAELTTAAVSLQGRKHFADICEVSDSYLKLTVMFFWPKSCAALVKLEICVIFASCIQGCLSC